ncbi:MAG: septum formation protein Maf [Candidatus Marinimicrobia bacterium]|jgi:septum formation protein|nr:septum formation protein Maf [Candidatus Neomarinimicrobiota bacterium]MBT3617187.1 septum formation protein Maf [Candidatus Neomarinimicrobiota bacterium]MBT3829776.1 septum formation protein Maf [Candidatus Neomarinimicrobiota bacterium]MBT3997877.1 septum formation protein Maf [Candidatus Neomarinimicrobiota bacterium]MBT4281255.1 septum formation protein Maf [Candidatus Neomarinimicrobiota bacterium]
MTEIPIILASESPRRKQLLDQIDIKCTVIPSEIEEEKPKRENPMDYAVRLASAKASAIAKTHPDGLVIGADTIVVLNDEILGKPADRNDAIRILSKLSGKTHTVITGVSIQSINHKVASDFYEETTVSFKNINDSDIYKYIDTYKPFDKAGSYGIQDPFTVWIRSINGCFFNVMGFPLSSFFERFRTIISQIDNKKRNTVGGKSSAL